MNRRRFLKQASKALASVAVAPAFFDTGLLWDPELLLWRPPKTFVFYGASHVVVSLEVFVREALRVISGSVMIYQGPRPGPLVKPRIVYRNEDDSVVYNEADSELLEEPWGSVMIYQGPRLLVSGKPGDHIEVEETG